ncbi:hypothetical protein KBD45_04855 [Candidatus Dojkabacteria bacterium]|nr:hypothetical protein [Candidatus Dojkabacteria bacterium]
MKNNNDLIIIAGPCSYDDSNLNVLYELSQIQVIKKSGKKERATFGVRLVGLKSRTKIYKDGSFMGYDYDTYIRNLEILRRGGNSSEFIKLPSIEICEKIIKDTNMIVGLELMSNSIQLPQLAKYIPDGKLLIWNPAINQLGWPILEVSAIASKKRWYVGLKNGKWLGEENSNGQTPLENTWSGLVSFSKDYFPMSLDNIFLIHRGVEVEHKGDFRSKLIHNIAHNTKKSTGAKLFFDPSHSYGPKLKHMIVEDTIKAMKLKTEEGNFLYNGILIEVGTAQTDTEQHISIEEYTTLVNELSDFRNLLA